MDSRLCRPSAFPLLNLPAELRNKVYELVLTTSEKTTVLPFEKDGKVRQRLFITDPVNNERKELNQLKCVSKQLYEEASPLSPHSAYLVFLLRNDTKDAASVICGRFIENTRVDALDTIRRIDVFERILHGARGYGKRVWDARGVSQLVKFAQAHPPAKVNVPRVRRAG